MSGETEWTLHEIRQAYGEILKHYNILIAPQPNRKREEETVPDSLALDIEEDQFDRKAFFAKMKEVYPKLKEAADRSGNAQTWHAGQSLDGLSQGMRERIEKGLKFGF